MLFPALGISSASGLLWFCARRARRSRARTRPASIPRDRNLRRRAPHAAAKRLRFRLGALQLGQSRQRHARRYPRESFANQRRVDELARFCDDVGEAPIVRVERRCLTSRSAKSVVLLEPRR